LTKGALIDNKSLHRSLKGTTMPGYHIDRQVTENSWIVSLQGPGMKSAWSMVVALTPAPQDAPGQSDMVSVGTTLWNGAKMPSPEILGSLLQLNAMDLNPGSLGLFKEPSGKCFVQYTIRIPREDLTTRKLEYALGYVAGYADGLATRLGKGAM
jgi:hypothetical protein